MNQEIKMQLSNQSTFANEKDLIHQLTALGKKSTSIDLTDAHVFLGRKKREF